MIRQNHRSGPTWTGFCPVKTEPVKTSWRTDKNQIGPIFFGPSPVFWIFENWKTSCSCSFAQKREKTGPDRTFKHYLLLCKSYEGISPMTTQTKMQKPRLPPYTVFTLAIFEKTKGVCSNPLHLVTIKLPSKVYYHPLWSSYCLCNLKISTTMYYHQVWDPWKIRGG